MINAEGGLLVKKWKTAAICILPVLFIVCAYVNTHYKGFPKVGPQPEALALSAFYGCVWTAAIFLLRDSRGWLRFFACYQGLALLLLALMVLCSDVSILPALLFLGLMLPYLGFPHYHFVLVILLFQEALSLYWLLRLKKRRQAER